MKKRLILLILLLLFLACGKTVSIEQKSKIGNYCDGTYKVYTQVWVNKYWGQYPVSLEYWESRRGIHKDDLEVIKQIEYKKAQVIADRVRECLKDGR